MDEKNIIAAILAAANGAPETVFNRYERLQKLIAEKGAQEAESGIPEGHRAALEQVKKKRAAS